MTQLSQLAPGARFYHNGQIFSARKYEQPTHIAAVDAAGIVWLLESSIDVEVIKESNPYRYTLEAARQHGVVMIPHLSLKDTYSAVDAINHKIVYTGHIRWIEKQLEMEQITTLYHCELTKVSRVP
jgi:hypothetical protein